MPIYFLLSIWVLLSVGHEPTPQAYFERGALFYNALTAGGHFHQSTHAPIAGDERFIPVSSGPDILPQSGIVDEQRVARSLSVRNAKIQTRRSQVCGVGVNH